MSGGWFVTGTDTGVGKTCVARALLQALTDRGWRAVGMKPIATGCRWTAEGLRADDAEQLAAAGSVAVDYADINPYAFEPAIAPHTAAARAGVRLQLETVLHHYARLRAAADWLVVEGAGGWLVPFDDRHTLADLAQRLRLPVILVVGIRLGCINHALLTERAIAASGLPCAGWVANCVDAAFEAIDETVATLEQRLVAPLLVRVPPNPGPAWRAAGAALLRRLVPA